MPRRHLVLFAVFAVLAAVSPAFAQSYEVVARFASEPGDPGDLLSASDGSLYGVTAGGGQFGRGTVYRSNLAGETTQLHSFTGGNGGTTPSFGLLEASDHHLYGATATSDNDAGTIYRIDANGTFVTVYSALGFRPLSKMVEVNGVLYGGFSDGTWFVTPNGFQFDTTGVFRFNPATGDFQSIHTFDPMTEGSGPASLAVGSDGLLYGTLEGGDRPIPLGAAFRMDTSGNMTVLHVFTPGTEGSPKSILQSSDGFFYGLWFDPIGNGTGIFRMNFNGDVVTIATLGPGFENSCGCRLPSLLDTGGYLYGTTSVGGDIGHGVVYRVSHAGALAILQSFDESIDHGTKTSLVLGPDDKFYATRGHEENDLGVIFRVTSGGAIQVVHTFLNFTGSFPSAPLIRAGDGFFYGTTYAGGVHGRGTVFRFAPGGDLTVLHSFTAAEGNGPIAALVQATDNRLYGITQFGGDSDSGTIFRISTAGSFETLYSFDGEKGMNPEASLIQAHDGWVYGAARDGGDFGYGTVFRVDTSGLVELVHSFEGVPADGGNPGSALLEGADGYLYGTTLIGGDTDHGTVFRLDIAGNITILHSFEWDEQTSVGAQFPNGLIHATDEWLYGTTREGSADPNDPANAGTIFRINVTGVFEQLHGFNGTDGAMPLANLFQAADGLIYGVTSTGGGENFWFGTLFRLGQNGITIVKIFGENNDDSGEGPNGPLVRGLDGLFYGTTGGGGAGGGVIFSLNLISETPVGTGVEVQPVDANTGTAPVNLTFNEIVDAGSTTVTVTTTAPVPPPAGFNLGDTPTYFDIETTATFNGAIQVCFDYSSTQIADPATAKLLHYDGTDWVNVTISNNVAARIICGSVTSLSPFVIGNEVAHAYTVNPTFDQNKVYKVGSTIPIRIQILDDGVNVSASSLSVVATGLRRKTVETNWGVPEDPGNSNPDLNFRYAAIGGQPGYQFNLKTTGYSKGTYELKFLVGPGRQELVIEFQVR